jgi:hypothetical protein
MTNRNALYIGEILVNIDTEWSSGDYTATTYNDHVFGHVALGFEISVTAFAYDPEDEEKDRPVAEVATELIEGMRHALARCFIFGEMRLVNDLGLEDEDWKVFQEVWDALAKEEGYFEITPLLTVEACKRQVEQDEATGEFLEYIGELMESQQRHEGENITFGEAMDRQKKGAEQLRRIVEEGKRNDD